MNAHTRDSQSHLVLAVIFTAMAFAMYSFSFTLLPPLNYLPLVFLIVACVSALGWWCGDKYWPSQILVGFLKIAGAYALHLILFAIALTILYGPRVGWMVKEELARRAAYQTHQQQTRLLEAPPGACAESAEITKGGEMYWCFSRWQDQWSYNRKTGQSTHGWECELDVRTCLSPNQPGPRTGYQGWCDETGKYQAVEFFETAGNSAVECRIDEGLCSDEDKYRFGTRLCVDYNDCQPAISHADAAPCVWHKPR